MNSTQLVTKRQHMLIKWRTEQLCLQLSLIISTYYCLRLYFTAFLMFVIVNTKVTVAEFATIDYLI